MDQITLVNMNDFVKTINPYLKAIGVFGSSLKLGKQLLTVTYNYVKGLTKRSYYDLNEIFNEVENENLDVGNIIETSGYFFKYGQVFKPYTHVNGMFSNCKKVEEKEVYKNGKRVIQASMVMPSKAFVPPIQKIPPFNGIGCAFLYDSRFKGFMHEFNLDKEEQKEKPFIVNSFSKPMMILYDISKYEKFINREVHLKCHVIKIPKELVSALNGIFDNTIREICDNFFRPYSENVNFICLSLLDNECDMKEISKIHEINTLKAPLYAEVQAEGLNLIKANEAQKLIESILPNLPQKLDPHFPFTVGTYTNNIGTPFLSINNINVIFREPEVLGFYCDSELFNNEQYQKNLQGFCNFVNNFSVDYHRVTQKILGVKKGIKLNFLFDYEKQFLFDKRGALNSDIAKNLYEIDESSRYIQNWLKGNDVDI